MGVSMANGAVKHDQGKVNIVRGCLQRFPRALAAVAKTSMLGCRKYNLPADDKGFAEVADGHGRYTDALGRHLLGEMIDGPVYLETGGALPEEGVPMRHDVAVAWNALARLEIKLREEEAELVELPE